MVEIAIALYGTTAAIPETHALRAGPVTMTFESGQLRWIQVGDVEALRAVSFLVRDSSWLTAVPDISDLRIGQDADSFTIGFSAECRTTDGAITWHGRIEGSAEGTIVFDATARPEADFTTCRTGFVILHPLEGVAGQPVRVGYTDGRFEDSRFPDRIDPYQTFKGIRSLAHEVAPGITATCTMEGDAWEIEDHRNWTDASFKTYVKLLEWGYPYVVKAGEEVRQRVSLRLSGPRVVALKAQPAEPAPVRMTPAAGGGTFPTIGISLPRRRLTEAAKVAARVSAVGPGFLHCRIAAAEAEPVAVLRTYGELAASIGSPVAVEIMVSDPDAIEGELRSAANAMAQAGVDPAAVIVVPAPSMLELSPGVPADRASIARIPEAARAVFPDRLLGGGVFGFFAELNRNMPPVENLDFLTHVTSALVHNNDDASVMETIAAIGPIVRSARALGGGKAHWLGPANIGLDDNPYGDCAPNPDNERLTMTRMDPRHRGVFGAAWLIGFVAAAANEGAARIVTAAPAGEIGLAHVPTDYAQPYFDDAGADTVYPVYHVLRAFCAAAGMPLAGAQSSDAQRVAALSYRQRGRGLLWLANLTAHEQPVELPEGNWRARTLDANSFVEATLATDFFAEDGHAVGGGRFVLPAYAVARLVTEAGR